MIPCDIHDYFEHVCVLKLKCSFNIKNNTTITGTVVDIITRNKEEFLSIKTETGSQEIPLIDISQMSYSENGVKKSISIAPKR